MVSSKYSLNFYLNDYLIQAEEKCEKLLVHPLVSALLDFKWKNCVRYVYYSSTLLFLTFLILLNHYVLLTPQFYRIDWWKLYSNRAGEMLISYLLKMSENLFSLFRQE